MVLVRGLEVQNVCDSFEVSAPGSGLFAIKTDVGQLCMLFHKAILTEDSQLQCLYLVKNADVGNYCCHWWGSCHVHVACIDGLSD